MLVGRALGFRFEVTCAHQPAEIVVGQTLSGLADDGVSPPGQDAERVHRVVVDGDDHAVWDHLADLVVRLNFGALDASQGQLILHAGALADAAGNAVLVPGEPGAGKSTLTAALGLAGLGYLTDEIVSIDPLSTTITPYRKPLSLKPGSHAVLPELQPHPAPRAEDTWLIGAGQFGAPPAGPLLPRLVVFPRFTPEAPLSVEPVSTAETAYLLGSNAVSLDQVRGGGVAALIRLARRVTAYRLVHGDVRVAAAEVGRLLAREAAA